MSGRVAVVISNFTPIIGGAEKQLQMISAKLVERGYTVDVITRSHKGLKYTENFKGINIFRVPTLKINKQLETTSFILSSLRHMIFNRKYDLLICSQLGSCSFIGKINKTLFKTPYISRVSGREAEAISKTEKGRKKFQKTCSKVDYIIALNKTIKNDLLNLNISEDRIVDIPNGVEIERMVDISRNDGILYCGRIEEIKGLDILLKAWEVIEGKDKNIKLTIVGDGSQANYLRNKFAYLKNVYWAGKTNEPSQYYKKARVLVLPSRYEGTSNTLLEVMARGIPVIATNVGGNGELISNNQTGVLVNAEDWERLADAILELYYDTKKLEYIRKNAYDYVQQKLSVEKIVNEYISLINKCRVNNPC